MAVSISTSDIAPGDQVLTLRAIQTNPETGACETRVSGQKTVQMAFECVDPGSSKISNGVSITDTTLVATNAINNIDLSFSDVDLTFDPGGIATWTMNYQDAGQIRLHASLDLAAVAPDPAINLTGISNIFVSVPAGFCVSTMDANSDCASSDVSCSAFKKAGEGFSLDVKVVAWESGADLIGSTEIRYDRMVLENTFGSELIGLNMPMHAEYFNGSNFLVNMDDNLGGFATTDLSFIEQYRNRSNRR